MNKEFLINGRYLDAMSIALNDNVYLLANEGTVRSQKTVSMIQAFFEAVQDSDEKLHLIAAENLDSVRDNILQSDFGLEVVYPAYVTRVKESIGGYYLRVKCDIPGKPKIKKILLCGFGNASQWKKINGKTIGCIFIDEVNMANEQFIKETFMRQASVKKPKIFWTLNGDVPTHFIYTEFINYCKIIGRDRTPASIVADMDNFPKRKGYYYLHWNFDDNPSMTEDQKERTRQQFPVGSYYHTIKILGERGAPGRLIYIDYLNREKHIKKLELRKYNRFGVGVDIGATRAQNSFSLVGFTPDFGRAGVIDKYSFKNLGYEEKKEKLISFIRNWQSQGANIEYVSIDSAEANFIQDLKAIFKRLGLPEVIASYKATIKQRIDMGIVLLASGRLEFNENKGGKEVYDSFAICKWVEGKEGQEREDLNLPHNDDIDSVEYALTRHMNALMRAPKYKEVA